MTPKINAALSEIRKSLTESFVEPELAEGAPDVFDSFMAESAAHVSRETGLPPTEALELVFEMAEAGEAEGVLPPIPDTDASIEECKAWLEAANDVAFTLQSVMEARRMDKEIQKGRISKSDVPELKKHSDPEAGLHAEPLKSKLRGFLNRVGYAKAVNNKADRNRTPNALKSPIFRKTPESAK